MKNIIKKVTALILTTSVIIGSGFVSIASENPYVDVNESDWYYNSVMHAKNEGYMTGVTPTRFDPGAYLQRQDLALMLMRHYISKGGTVTQQDDGTYYGKAIAWVKDKGIMKGYSNGDFGVGDAITRQDCIVTLDRYMTHVWGLLYASPIEIPNFQEQMESFKSTYADTNQLRDYSYTLMFASVMNWKLITGVERDGVKYLDPNEPTTRGTVSVMTDRWFDYFKAAFIQ